MNYKFLTDNDGHWFLVPINKVVDFYRWVYAMDNDLEVTGECFEKCRIDSPTGYIVTIPLKV